jgi:ketol-acid reductoisomerase
MIDNCSTTARLGARKWASSLDYLLEQNMNGEYESKIGEFIDHPIHNIYKDIREL